MAANKVTYLKMVAGQDQAIHEPTIRLFAQCLSDIAQQLNERKRGVTTLLDLQDCLHHAPPDPLHLLIRFPASTNFSQSSLSNGDRIGIPVNIAAMTLRATFMFTGSCPSIISQL